MYRLKKFAKKMCPCCPPEPVKNCAVCILSNTLLIGHFITPILGSCKHSKRRFSNTQSFSISKIGLICDCFLFVFFGAMTFSYSYDTLQECVNLKEKIACLQLWGDQIFAVSGMNCMLCFLAQIKTRLEELNCWARLMEKSGSFGFTNIVCEYCTRGLKTRNWRLVVVMLGTIAFFVATRTYVWIQTASPLSMARDVSIFFSLIVQLNVVFQFTQKSDFLNCITESWKMSIFRKFRARLERGGVTDFEDSVKKYIRFGLALKENYNKINNFLSPTVLICLFTSAAILIINFYLMVIGTSFGMFQLRTFVIILGLLTFLCYVESLKHRVSSF
jgi:hypothetical protein